ncbi:MAG TPA: phosphopantetheine-binding protein [Acidimicrobiia bacterium]|nr:phosphopantetheine-binding protein [Acidimicrobiia bacterium]
MAFPALDELLVELREIAEDDEITGASKLAEIEVDSLDILEWVFEIERKAGIEVDESIYDKDALADSTVGDLYERIKSSAATG